MINILKLTILRALLSLVYNNELMKMLVEGQYHKFIKEIKEGHIEVVT